MPYRRNPYKRRKMPRRRNYAFLAPKTAKAVKAIATRAVKTWTPLREIRYVATVSQLLTNGTVGQRCNATHLTNIAIGDQLNQRTGPKVYITGIKFDLYAVNASTTLDRHFNFALVTDISRAQTLDTTTFSNLMEDSSFAETAPSAVNTNFQYYYNKELVKVHKARRLLLTQDGSGNERKSVSFFWKPRRPHKVQYERTNSTEVVSGKIWLVIHLAEAAQTASADVVDYQWRARVFYRSV